MRSLYLSWMFKKNLSSFQMLRWSIDVIFVLDLDKISCIEPFVLLRIILRIFWDTRILQIDRAYYIIESKLTVCMYFFIPIKSTIINDENKIELTLTTDLDALLHQVFRPPIFCISQLIRILNALYASFLACDNAIFSRLVFFL